MSESKEREIVMYMQQQLNRRSTGVMPKEYKSDEKIHMEMEPYLITNEAHPEHLTLLDVDYLVTRQHLVRNVTRVGMAEHRRNLKHLHCLILVCCYRARR